jgi:hypothetical protein
MRKYLRICPGVEGISAGKPHPIDGRRRLNQEIKGDQEQIRRIRNQGIKEMRQFSPITRHGVNQGIRAWEEERFEPAGVIEVVSKTR